MKKHTLKPTLIRIGTTLLASVLIAGAEPKEIAEVRKVALELIGPIPNRMPGSEHDTPALIALGKKLYFEKKLSVNNTISCNSCHMVDKNLGGVDNEPTSPGAFAKRGGRNSPTTLNAGFQTAQFWDGRAADLVAQAKGPVLNPIEMAMPDEKVVIQRLAGDAGYTRDFAATFPGDKHPISYDNVAKAIAAFERTLVTRDRFDDFQKGQDDALQGDELKGAKLFLSIGCASCHNGPVLGGSLYMKVGLVHPYPTSDLGRYDVTKQDDDKQKFKVPILRNIAITGPYFHDGSVKALDDAVRKMAHHQLDKKLTDDEVKQLVAFLKTLTDKPRASAR